MPVKYQIWRVDPVGVFLVGENRADAAVLSTEIVVEIKLIVPEYDRLVSKLTCTDPADDIRIDLVKLTEALRYLESCVDADVDFLRAGDWGAWYSSASSAAFAASCLRISTVPVRDDESTANAHSEAINSTLYLPPRRFPGRRFSVSFVCMVVLSFSERLRLSAAEHDSRAAETCAHRDTGCKDRLDKRQAVAGLWDIFVPT